MAWRHTSLTYKRHSDPEGAKKLLLDALERAGGQVGKAMKLLDVSSFTWYRYVKDLGLIDAMAAIKQMNGVTRGRPSKYSDEKPVPKAASVFE